MGKSRGNTDAVGLTVWGCRGSVSIGGAGYARYGGMTTCIELDRPEGRIIIDAGSGLGALGRTRGVDRKPTLLLFSHLHSDHIIGFPHFSPLYAEGWDLEIQGVPRAGIPVLDFLLDAHRPPMFPVALRDAVRPNLSHHVADPEGSRRALGVDLAWMEVAHPGGCSAFRMDFDGYRVVFTGDVEIEEMTGDAFRAFCADADVLIMDAQYDPGEYGAHRGWGHSTNVQAADFARACGASRLVLTHHDPRHDDARIDAMVEEARAIHPSVIAAECGLRVPLAGTTPSLAATR